MTRPMTSDRIQEIREAEREATPGAWVEHIEDVAPITQDVGPVTRTDVPVLRPRRVFKGIMTAWDHGQLHGPAPVITMAGGFYGTHVHIRQPDIRFITLARSAVPELLDEVERLRAEVEALRAELPAAGG